MQHMPNHIAHQGWIVAMVALPGRAFWRRLGQDGEILYFAGKQLPLKKDIEKAPPG